jgi:hypothetical protein
MDRNVWIGMDLIGRMDGYEWMDMNGWIEIDG